MSYYNPNEIFLSTSSPAAHGVVCYSCRREFYNQVPGWRFTDYQIKCPYCGVPIGVSDH